MNNINIIGNLTKDAELKYTQSGQAVLEGTIADNSTKVDANGNKKEEVNFIQFAIFGKRGESLAAYMVKGQPVYLFGQLKISQWQDTAGAYHSRTSVMVNEVKLLGGQRQQPAAPAPASPYSNAGATPNFYQAAPAAPIPGVLPANFDENIPF